jgi:AAA+ superfamily predicted ATPase
MPKVLIRKLLTEKITSREMLVEPLLHPSPNAAFGLKDFPHVNTELLTRYLNAATQARRVGTSVLLYGDSGTGKTELSRALAKRCGRTLYEIRSTALASKYADDEFNSRFPNKDRLRYLSLLNSLLTNKSNAMLLVDECEGLFENVDSQYSKEHLQRFIEQNDIPCIWITNYVQSLEVSFIRRFKLAVHVPSLKPEEIESVTRSYYRGLGLSLAVRKRISQVENITPAIVANATHIAHTVEAKSGDAEAVVNDVVEYSLRATEQWQDKLNYKGEIPFKVSYLNIKQPRAYLDDITYALKHNLPSRTLISGPPGTGKTAYAHYLAELNNRKLLRVKCSDVLSKWVGESEQKIAELFQRAHAEEQVILLDEVDSLLSAREGLSAQHELQFVNEFLTQIECFTQPLFAATNFVTKLDKAVLRRFDFKLDCQYLTSVQVLALYKQITRVKRLSEPESETLLQLKYLTPGDFAILARRTKFRPNVSIRDFAINLLADENQRKQAKPQPGFIRPH